MAQIYSPTWDELGDITWAEWPWQTWLGPYLVAPAPRYAARVRVKRGNEWVDITHRVADGTIVNSNDDVVATLDLRLLNGSEYDSLAPRVRTSPLNIVDGQYAPLLDRYNEITVEAAMTTDGSEPTEFVQLFGGYLGDTITTGSESGGVTLTLMVRDYAKQLMDDYIMGPVEYGDMWASDIIQTLLDRRHAEGHLPQPIALRLLGDDDFWIEEVTFEYVSTWDAIQSFAQQSNKDIRYMLDETTGTMRLTYWTPSTTMVPGWILDAGDIRRETLETSDAGNRYRVTVRYRDNAGKLQDAVAEDMSHRRPNEPIREALIEESDTSLIRTHNDAMRLANAVLEGTKSTPATDSLQVPFSPHMRLYDVIQVANSDVRSEAELYAIEQLRWSFSADSWATEVVASETVKLRPRYWLSIEAKRGVNDPLRPEDIAPSRLLDAPTGVTVTSITGGIAVSWDEPADPRNLQAAIVRVRDADNVLVRVLRTQDTLVEVTSGLQAGQEYTATVQFEDIKGRLTEESAPNSGGPGLMTLASSGGVMAGFVDTPDIALHAISDCHTVNLSDDITTESDDYVLMEGMELEFVLDGPAYVWFAALAPVRRRSWLQIILGSGSEFGVRFVVDGEAIYTQEGVTPTAGIYSDVKWYGPELTYPHTVRATVEWANLEEDTVFVTTSNRSMSALVLKR